MLFLKTRELMLFAFQGLLKSATVKSREICMKQMLLKPNQKYRIIAWWYWYKSESVMNSKDFMVIVFFYNVIVNNYFTVHYLIGSNAPYVMYRVSVDDLLVNMLHPTMSVLTIRWCMDCSEVQIVVFHICFE